LPAPGRNPGDPSSSVPAASVTGTETGTGACAAAQAIVDLDQGNQSQINDAMQRIMAAGDASEMEAAFASAWSDVVASLDALEPELAAQYDQLAQAVPADLADDVTLLRDFTAELAIMFRTVDSLEDLQAFALDEENTRAAVAATFTIDDWSVATCGFTFANT